MTTQQKLHAVETAIRKALPRLMELSYGCKLKGNKFGNEYKFISQTTEEGKDYTSYHLYDKDYNRPTVFITDFFVIDPNDYTAFTILGHDILLSDVLEWLRLFNNDYCLWDGMFLKPVGASNYYAEFETINGESFDKNTIKLDLSKPYLKDQSEELIDFLYNLIKE